MWPKARMNTFEFLAEKIAIDFATLIYPFVYYQSNWHENSILTFKTAMLNAPEGKGEKKISVGQLTPHCDS